MYSRRRGVFPKGCSSRGVFLRSHHHFDRWPNFQRPSHGSGLCVSPDDIQGVGDVSTNAERTFDLCRTQVSLFLRGLLQISSLQPSLLLPFSYIYSGTLPSTSTMALVQELLAAISSNPKLVNLVDLCNAFIGSYDLKQRTNHLFVH